MKEKIGTILRWQKGNYLIGYTEFRLVRLKNNGFARYALTEASAIAMNHFETLGLYQTLAAGVSAFGAKAAS